MKLALVGVLTFALLWAGCVQTPVRPASVVDFDGESATTSVVHTIAGETTPVTSGLVRAVGSAFHTGFAAAEPTVGVTSDGSIFMTAKVKNPTCDVVGGCPVAPPIVPNGDLADLNMGPTIVRSQDKGQTWKDVFPKLPTGDSYKLRSWDPYLYVDRDTDRVFMDDIYPLGCGFTSWTDNKGDSWTHNPASCGNPNLNDHQTIVTAQPRVTPALGYPNLVYRCVNDLVYAACAISVNGGQTFLPQIPIGPTVAQDWPDTPIEGQTTGCAAITGHLEADREGRVYLGLSCKARASVLMTEDDGRTWSLASLGDPWTAGHEVDLATDDAGNVYAFYRSYPSDDANMDPYDMPYLSISRDHGRTWSEPVPVAPPGVTKTRFNSIAAGSPGKVAFAYLGTTIPDAHGLPGDAKEWAGATWNAYIGVIEDALAPTLVIQTVTANDPADPLARGECAASCPGMRDFIDVVIDEEGRPWASFVDLCVAECVSDPSVIFDGNIGLAATLVSGPALRGDVAALTAIAPPPAVESTDVLARVAGN